jgi:hypothetical protein
MRKAPATLLVLLFFVSPFRAQTCTWVDQTGAIYDISSLKGTTDYVFNTPDGKYTFYINVCTSIIYQQCGKGCAACQTWVGGKASVGSFNTSTIGLLNGGGEGVTIGFTQGDGGRSSEIDFICTPSAGKVTINQINSRYF